MLQIVGEPVVGAEVLAAGDFRSVKQLTGSIDLAASLENHATAEACPSTHLCMHAVRPSHPRSSHAGEAQLLCKFRWLRAPAEHDPTRACMHGICWAPIPGASKPAYTITPDDAGCLLKATVTTQLMQGSGMDRCGGRDGPHGVPIRGGLLVGCWWAAVCLARSNCLTQT